MFANLWQPQKVTTFEKYNLTFSGKLEDEMTSGKWSQLGINANTISKNSLLTGSYWLFAVLRSSVQFEPSTSGISHPKMS